MLTVAILVTYANAGLAGDGAGHLRAEANVQSLAFEVLGCFLGDLGVRHKEKVVESFENNNLGTETMPHAPELKADGARTDNAQALRYLGKLKRTPGIDDILSVDRRDGQFDRDGAAREYHVLGANRFFFSIGGRDFDAMIRQQAAVTLQRRNAVSLKERGDAAGQLRHDAGFARLHRGNIYTELSHADAVSIELRRGPVVKLRRLQ